MSGLSPLREENEEMAESKPELCTLKRFVEKYPDAWTESGLRWLRANEDTNGFQGAFVKVGGRLFIDEIFFFECVRRQE